jgi:hypothetical protein
LAATADPRIIRIDARVPIRPAVNVGRVEHDLGETFQSAALACRFRSDNIFTGSSFGPVMISPFESVLTAVLKKRSASGASGWVDRIW